MQNYTGNCNVLKYISLLSHISMNKKTKNELELYDNNTARFKLENLHIKERFGADWQGIVCYVGYI